MRIAPVYGNQMRIPPNVDKAAVVAKYETVWRNVGMGGNPPPIATTRPAHITEHRWNCACDCVAVAVRQSSAPPPVPPYPNFDDDLYERAEEIVRRRQEQEDIEWRNRMAVHEARQLIAQQWLHNQGIDLF